MGEDSSWPQAEKDFISHESHDYNFGGSHEIVSCLGQVRTRGREEGAGLFG